MIDLQEIISRGRFLFAGAPQRLKTFELVNGRRSTGQISKQLRRHINNINRDIRLLSDSGLIQARVTVDDRSQLKIERLPVYEKVPLVRTIPIRYFNSTSQINRQAIGSTKQSKTIARGERRVTRQAIPIPSESEILDICKSGEDQIYEFKGQGTETDRIVREIAAMLNTARGGLIFLGIDDDGTIQGAGIKRQKFDQPLQNSVRNRISPAATIRLFAVSVMGSEIIIIMVPPWNRKTVYFLDGRVYLRKGTNAFQARPEEIGKLHRGEPVI